MFETAFTEMSAINENKIPPVFSVKYIYAIIKVKGI